MSLGKSFREATRLQTKAAIMIEGIAGRGKSGLALSIAHALATSWEKVYAIDTENMSLDLFKDLKLHTGDKIAAFKKVDLTSEDGYTPSNYEALRDDAIRDGAEVVIMDSYSHMWTREKGVLDLVSSVKNNSSGKDFNAWNDPKVIREKNKIFEMVRSSKVHIITTVRSKEKFEMEKDESTGKSKVVSLGEQQIQQDGLKYEPDLVLRMVSAGNTKGKAPVATVLKSRYAIFEEGVEYTFDEAMLKQLKEYINEGVDPTTLLDQQKNDYITGIKDYCSGNKTRMSVWRNIKDSAGFAEAKIEDIPLETLRAMFIQLTQEQEET